MPEEVGHLIILGSLGPGVGLAVSFASVVLMAIMPEKVGLCQGDGDADDGPGVGLAVSFAMVGVGLSHVVDVVGAGGDEGSSISTSFSRPIPLGFSSLITLSS